MCSHLFPGFHLERHLFGRDTYSQTSEKFWPGQQVSCQTYSVLKPESGNKVKPIKLPSGGLSGGEKTLKSTKLILCTAAKSFQRGEKKNPSRIGGEKAPGLPAHGLPCGRSPHTFTILLAMPAISSHTWSVWLKDYSSFLYLCTTSPLNAGR